MKLTKTVAALALVCASACTDRPVNPPTPQQVEAGVIAIQQGVDTSCKWLEGVTDNGTVLTICAVAEEFAEVIAFLGPFLLAEGAPDAGCTPVTARTCATPRQLGRAIQHVLAKRNARLMLDAGAAR